MPELSTLALFALSSAAILALPGPTMLYVVARTLEHGRTGGLVSVALAASATAMTVVQVGGAFYLVSLGLQRLRSPSKVAEEAGPAAGGRGRLFWHGVALIVLGIAAVALH